MRAIKRIVIHHSASTKSSTSVEDITRWHIEKKYDGIGYHRVIEAGGLLKMGRPDERIGAHAYRFNSDSLGICVCGNFEVEQPDDEQVKILVQVLATLCQRHGLKPEAIIGHRDLMATACPGKNLYAQLPTIRKRVAAYLK